MALYVGVSILSSFAVWVVNMPALLKVPVIMLMIIAAIYYVMRDVLLCLPWSWHQVLLSSHGQLSLLNRRLELCEPVLAASSVNHPLLTVLHFNRSSLRFGWQCTLMLMPWQITDADQFRRLRVWLKWAPYVAGVDGDDSALAD